MPSLSPHRDSAAVVTEFPESDVVLPLSGGDNWTQQSYVPHYDKTLWLENGKEISVPEGFYSSEFIVDKAIQQLENNQENHEEKRKPFFSYVSFQAVVFRCTRLIGYVSIFRKFISACAFYIHRKNVSLASRKYRTSINSILHGLLFT